MSSTNKTTNYELSQFIGADKPAWLTDYNTDMSKIDAGIHSAQTTATGADGKADANTNNIGDLTYLSTTAKNTLVAAINEVDSNTDTAQNTANTALTNAGAANTAIAGINAYLDINTFASFSGGTTNNGAISFINMNYATNSTSSLGKIYGTIDVNSVGAADTTITLTEKTSFRPDSKITILCAGINTPLSGNISYPVSIDIDTDGTIQIKTYMEGNKLNRLILHPVLLFIKNFGDAS